MLWSNYPHNLCVLRQVEIVSTQVGNAGANTPKLRMASTSLIFLVSASVFKPTKMGREVSCLFCVSEVMTALLTSYYGWRQSIAKLTAQPYYMIIALLLIALSHTFQSVWNLLMFLKLVELIHLEFFFFFILFILNFLWNFPWNTFDLGTVEAYQIRHCMQYARPPQCLC